MKSHGSFSRNISRSPLPKSFYQRPVDLVAAALLGKGLWVEHSDVKLLAEITEVEAYAFDDAASHSFRGPTKRNWPMFEEGGICYVYLIYGINLCANISTGEKGRGEAVLLRAAQPLIGVEWMRQKRNLPGRKGKEISDTRLLSGPGNLARGLGLTMSHNGLTFFGDTLRVVDLGNTVLPSEIARTPRIGISQSAELLRRYCIVGAPSLSRKG